MRSGDQPPLPSESPREVHQRSGADWSRSLDTRPEENGPRQEENGLRQEENGSRQEGMVERPERSSRPPERLDALTAQRELQERFQPLRRPPALFHQRQPNQ